MSVKRIIGIWCLYISITSIYLDQPTVSAQSRVLLFDTADYPERQELYITLRIQLSGLAEVSRAGRLTGTSLSYKVDEAIKQANKQKATLAIWVEGPIQLQDGRKEIVLYVVGEQQGRALLDVLRIPRSGGASVDRSLALKVREVLEKTAQGNESQLLRPSKKQPQTTQPKLNWGYIADLGIMGAYQPNAELGQWGIIVGGGIRLNWSHYNLSGQGSFHLYPQLESRHDKQAVLIDEMSPGLLLRGWFEDGIFSYGAHVGLQLRIINAIGITGRGARGETETLIPSIVIAPEGQLRLYHNLSLRLGLGAQFGFYSQRFTVNQQEVITIEKIRPLVQISFVFRSS